MTHTTAAFEIGIVPSSLVTLRADMSFNVFFLSLLAAAGTTNVHDTYHIHKAKHRV